jgi:crossover junction endodeoxyribonuclease RusA
MSPTQRTLTLDLPWPPTVNHYWLQGRNGSRFISKEGRAFRQNVAVALALRGLFRTPLLTGDVGIEIEAYPPDRRRRDLDNILKALLDALQHTGVYEDDSQVCRIHIVRRNVVEGGKVSVVVGG